ncbi:ATP-binding protein [Candidatus Woesearchaeota archaeon]|nr:ATP-binding protein [Candidatus Woesearchaeota archaeon]
MADFIDVIRRMRKLSPEEDKSLDSLEWYLLAPQKRIVKGLLKEKKIAIEHEQFSLGGLIDTISLPKLVVKKNVPEAEQAVTEINESINRKTQKTLFDQFSRQIHDKCSQMIAPNIVGFETVKKAVALQLFSPERIHILLLGDPGTGKTQILSAATELAPVSSMGLGSGTSGVGLAVTVKGKDVIKGLLPMADNGLCAIDELNLMKEESRASLYNAMEKGFVSYDKGGHSYKFDARVSVLATANPKGDKFTGTTIGELKKQLPFDAALLTRFHLTFLVRKHDIEEFKAITKALLNKTKQSLTKKEQEFLKQYVRQAHELGEIKLPKRFEQEIVDFIADIKENEKKYLVEISPRMVVGFSRLAKASARMELRKEVEEKDVVLVKQIVKESLKLK